MDIIIMKATEHVNPGQFPVLTVDQPLYAIAAVVLATKHMHVVLMGGLHIERPFLCVVHPSEPHVLGGQDHCSNGIQWLIE